MSKKINFYRKTYVNMLQHNKKYLFLYGILSILLALGTTAFSFIEPEKVFIWWLQHPVIILLNALPLFLFMLMLHAVARKASLPVLVVAIVLFALCMANREKILYREEPLFFADLVIWREAIKIVVQGSFSMTKYVAMGVVLAAALVILFRNSWGRYTMTLGERLCMGISSVAIFSLCLPLFYSDLLPIEGLIPPQAKEEVNISQTFRDQGQVYSMLRYRDVNNIQKPKPFLEREVKERIAQFTPRTLERKPDVIMIMGEAWNDVSENENLHFHPDMDPFEQVRPIMDSALGQGHILAPTFGGGTANTEYDGLTGNATLFLSDSRFTSYQATRRKIDSIVSALMNQGYNSYALHPGYSWFYNREKVYGYLGFQRSEFFEDFEYPQIKGKFISEEQTMARFTARLDELAAQENPYLAFLVTIQNHSPFNAEKYGSVEDTFTSDVPLTQETKEMLESYFVGIRDMNREIVHLVNKLQNSSRPTVLIYWGDHQPFLGNNYQAFRELGYAMDQNQGDVTSRSKIYQTPYFIWGNAAYKAQFPPQQYPVYVNANYIPVMVLQSFGATEIDPFFSFEKEMMEKLPVIHKYFMIEGREPLQFRRVNFNQDQERYFHLFRSWQYLRAK